LKNKNKLLAYRINTKERSNYVQSVKKGHRRIETRRCEVFEKGLIADFEQRWKKRTSVIKITSIREFPTKKNRNAGTILYQQPEYG